MTTEIDVKQEPQDMSFEEAFEQLNQVIESLENGHGTLSERTSFFEFGVKLSQRCSSELDDMENRIEILLEQSEGGTTEAFEMNP